MQTSLGFAVAALSGSGGLGLIFLTSGVSKLRHRVLLPGVIASYRLLPDFAVAPVAIALPFVETLTGAALIAGITPVPVAVAILLLTVFAAAMAINIRRGRTHIDCGCGRSQLRHPISWALVARNAILAALLAPALLPRAQLGAMDLATAFAGGIAIFVAYVLFNSIGALIASPAALRR